MHQPLRHFLCINFRSKNTFSTHGHTLTHLGRGCIFRLRGLWLADDRHHNNDDDSIWHIWVNETIHSHSSSSVDNRFDSIAFSFRLPFFFPIFLIKYWYNCCRINLQYHELSIIYYTKLNFVFVAPLWVSFTLPQSGKKGKNLISLEKLCLMKKRDEEKKRVNENRN